MKATKDEMLLFMWQKMSVFMGERRDLGAEKEETVCLSTQVNWVW